MRAETAPMYALLAVSWAQNSVNRKRFAVCVKLIRIKKFLQKILIYLCIKLNKCARIIRFKKILKHMGRKRQKDEEANVSATRTLNIVT